MLKTLYSEGRIHKTIYTLVIILGIFGFLVLGLATLAEFATVGSDANIFSTLWFQGALMLVGLLCMHIASHIPHHLYNRFIILLVGVATFFMLLLFTDLAVSRGETVRWLYLFGFNFQPSEMMKLIFVMLIAALFSNEMLKRYNTPFLLYSFGSLGLIGVAAYLQPDYGTFVILLAVFFLVALISKLTKVWWAIAVIAITAIATFFIVSPPAYVKDRFTTFYNIVTDNVSQEERFGDAYQPIQTGEAVESGGFLGKGIGYNAGNPGVIPEITTDSIFALLAQETGFIGSFILIMLYLLLFGAGFTIASRAKKPFSILLATGITTLLAIQVFLNIAVVLGAPATGIPLLFFSKGGSSILFTFIAIGILLNIEKYSRTRYIQVEE